MPPIPHNFRRIPLVTRGPYDFHKIDDLFGSDLSGDGYGELVPDLSMPMPHGQEAAHESDA